MPTLAELVRPTSVSAFRQKKNVLKSGGDKVKIWFQCQQLQQGEKC